MDPKIAFCTTNVNFQTKFQSQKLIIKISQTEFKLIRETFFWYVENKVFIFLEIQMLQKYMKIAKTN